jgi:hypothetical protein
MRIHENDGGFKREAQPDRVVVSRDLTSSKPPALGAKETEMLNR